MSPGQPRGHTSGHASLPANGRGAVGHESCIAVREVLNRVGDKWSVLIVGTLGAGPLRFGELRRRIEGISQRMLTLTLKGLERDGLLTRTVTPSIPPRVDYQLTRLGLTLLEPVGQLYAWADKHRGTIEAARVRFDAKGRRIKPVAGGRQPENPAWKSSPRSRASASR